MRLPAHPMTTPEPSDSELSALVAERCAGWRLVHAGSGSGCTEHNPLLRPFPPYATSADAVIPLLEDRTCTIERLCGYEGFPEYWKVEVFDGQRTGMAENQSLPRAICLCLLSAHASAREERKP